MNEGLESVRIGKVGSNNLKNGGPRGFDTAGIAALCHDGHTLVAELPDLLGTDAVCSTGYQRRLVRKVHAFGPVQEESRHRVSDCN